MLLHDWQFGAISHPFFEFHDFRIEWGENIDAYLATWGEYESLERAREAYQLSRLLGWLLKARGILASIRKGEASCKFRVSLNRTFLIDCYDFMEGKVSLWVEARRSSQVTGREPVSSLQ